jgi:DNA-binding response OmpR family regulator
LRDELTTLRAGEEKYQGMSVGDRHPGGIGTMAKKRVLVVDDHPPTVKIIRRALEGEGLDVCEAANGADCLLAVASEQPDLVILDVVMPVMDGFQTLRVLREQEETKLLPVIMLTGRKEDHEVLRGWMSGVDMYLTKPFQVPELLAAARRILSVAGPGHANETAEGRPRSA